MGRLTAIEDWKEGVVRDRQFHPILVSVQTVSLLFFGWCAWDAVYVLGTSGRCIGDHGMEILFFVGLGLAMARHLMVLYDHIWMAFLTFASSLFVWFLLLIYLGLGFHLLIGGRI